MRVKEMMLVKRRFSCGLDADKNDRFHWFDLCSLRDDSLAHIRKIETTDQDSTSSAAPAPIRRTPRAGLAIRDGCPVRQCFHCPALESGRH